jgi:hypothetical protein
VVREAARLLHELVRDLVRRLALAADAEVLEPRGGAERQGEERAEDDADRDDRLEQAESALVVQTSGHPQEERSAHLGHGKDIAMEITL